MKLRKKKLKLSKETEEWLDKSLVEEGNKLLNNSPSKEEIVSMYLIAKMNWLIAMEEIKKLTAQIQILRRDKW